MFFSISCSFNCDRVSKRSSVVDEETSVVFHTISLQFQSFTSYNTMGWKCSLKSNCVRSCLMEPQSFFDDSKINIDPKYCIFMSLTCILQVSCMTRHRIINIFWILMIFIPRVNRHEEHRLSFAQNLTSRYQSIADN